MNSIKVNYRVIRSVILSWIVGWYIKIHFLLAYLFRHIEQYPMDHPLFPSFLKNPLVAQSAYILPIAALILMTRLRQSLYIIASFLMMISSIILFLHLDTYNDATFVTSFWVALWICWFSFQLNRTDANLKNEACGLAQCIVGMIFLGGTIGKLTPQFYSGDVFFNIFMTDNPTWIFYWVKNNFSLAQQHIIAIVISKFIIFMEAFLALTPLWPTRLIAVIAPVAMLSITITNTWRILSVLSCLIGLMVACLLWKEERLSENSRTFKDYA